MCIACLRNSKEAREARAAFVKESGKDEGREKKRGISRMQP